MSATGKEISSHKISFEKIGVLLNSYANAVVGPGYVIGINEADSGILVDDATAGLSGFIVQNIGDTSLNFFTAGIPHFKCFPW